jgi:ribosome-binding factor A
VSKIRVEKIAKFIKQRVSEIILRELHDPRVGFVTVTKVKVTGDLRNAQIYVSVLGSAADRSRTWHALQQARGYVQRAIADELDTYATPEIEFRYDESIEGSIRVSRIVDEAVAESRPPLPTPRRADADGEVDEEDVEDEESED